MSQQPYLPRESPVIGKGGLISPEWDRSCLQPLVAAVNALSTSILSGPDADPNGVVVGRPGYLYRRMGDDSVTVSDLYFKASGVNTNTGWVLK